MLTNRVQSVFHSSYPWVYWDNFFSEEQLNSIDEYVQKFPLEDGSFNQNNILVTNNEIRKSKIAFIDVNEENEHFFNTLLNLTEFINDKFFRFDLIGFDYLQYTVYDTYGSHYDFHTDSGDLHDTKRPPRKLSFSLILSNSSEYEGGEFEFCTGSDISNAAKVEQPKGRVIAFPSYIRHRVKPVTHGVRRSLVFWACGPAFR